MTLKQGEHLGPYEILSPIGAGGMGEVYEARDTRLNRTVAIKVLPDHLATDARRRERFEREARAIAALNHPHICTLYDVGHHQGTDFLVMEYLEGETLAERLTKGALPLHEGLRYAIEMADALASAHRQGVVHRDLKPGNIMLTHSGTKILDFGLAKLAGHPGEAPVGSALSTQGRALTEDGAILGTFQYMAPEQLEGKDATERTDLFAFGSVLYEMVTGKKAFEGKSQASLIAAILERQPPRVSSLQPVAPPALDRVLAKCLAKAPEQRWGSADDVKELLQWVVEEGSFAGPPRETAAMGRRARMAWWPSAALALLAITVAGLALWQLSERKPGSVTRFVIAPPPGEPIVVTPLETELAISPDGENIVYRGGAGPMQLYVRPRSALGATPLERSGPNPRVPFFSPDGLWIGFYNAQALHKISVHGGPAIRIADCTSCRGAAWGPDDKIIYAPFGSGQGLLRVSAGGGEPEVLTVPDATKGEDDHLWPEILPGGKVVLFSIISQNSSSSQVAALSLQSGEKKILIPGGACARYAPTGHLVYAVEGALMAVRFDPERIETSGSPFRVLDSVNQKNTTFGANFAFSQDGTLAYIDPQSVSAESVRRRRLLWVDRRGQAQALPLPPGNYDSPSLSPDGRELALVVTDASGMHVWVYDLERGTLGKRSFEGMNRFPIWTPDGQYLLYGAGGSGYENILRVRADGSGKPEFLLVDKDLPGLKVPISQSPDNKALLFQYTAGTWHLPLGNGRKAQSFVIHDTATVREARFSPDGNWIAYRSDETGRDEVYVRPYPEAGGKWQISTSGGAQPMWSPAGRELFYKNGNRLMVVEVETKPQFKAGTPRVLFERALPVREAGDPDRYAVSRDGQRFLLTAPADDNESKVMPESSQIHVVLNWFQELERLDPSRK